VKILTLPQPTWFFRFAPSFLAERHTGKKKKKRKKPIPQPFLERGGSLAWGNTILKEASSSFLDNEIEKIAFNIAFHLIVYGAILLTQLG